MKTEATKALTKRPAKKRAATVDIDAALGHAAFAMTMTILEELVAIGAISNRRRRVLSRLARGRLISVPSYATAEKLLELEQAEREIELPASHH
jgi:hypothetical protein